MGLRGWHFQVTSLASIYLCIALWIRAKTVDQEERGNAERRALFVGLWPPMFWLIGDAVQLGGTLPPQGAPGEHPPPTAKWEQGQGRTGQAQITGCSGGRCSGARDTWLLSGLHGWFGSPAAW